MTTQTSQTTRTDLTGDYTIDVAHSRLGFVARHAMITKVRGAFNDFEGTAFIDADNPQKSQVTITIQAASIDTRNEQRDAHLRSNDFLDLATYPQITFVARRSSRSPATSTGSPATSPSAVSPSRSRSTSSSPARPSTRSATPGSAWRARSRSTARTGASTGTPRSRLAAFLVSEEITLEFEISAIKSVA